SLALHSPVHITIVYPPASRAPPFLPSFPTRRSSDLKIAGLHNMTRHGCGCGFSMRSRNPDSKFCPHQFGQHFRSFYDGYVLVQGDRKSTRLNSSHVSISYAVFCLKKKKKMKSDEKDQ